MRSFFQRPADVVARDLLGCEIWSDVRGRRAGGRIVETEAYVGPQDPASHAARRIGRTERNEVMHGPAGAAYVYFIYGMHWCLNVVTGEVGDPQAVLIRALEPLDGLSHMAERRGRDRDLCNGPARLCQALGVDGALNGHELSSAPLRIVRPPGLEAGSRVGVSGRIGIRLAKDWPFRFFIQGNPHVSTGPHVRVPSSAPA